MSIELVTLLLFGSLVLVLLMGLPLAFVLGGLAVVFVLILWGPLGLYEVALKTYIQMSNFVLVACPLFIFMANILQRSGIADDLYEAMYRWFGRLRGGLAMGTVVICAMFAAMSGISGAATVSMGLIALPSMRRYNYDKDITIGSIAGGGALGILSPPSVTMIILGLFAEVSIGALFAGGVFAGLFLALLFIVYIGIRCAIQPHLGPPVPMEERSSWSDKFMSLRALVLPMALIIAVLGSIFMGVATPTEAAAVGAVGSLISAAVYRKLNWRMFQEVLNETLKLSGMVLWIIYGAACFVAVYQAVGAQELVAGLFEAIPGGRWGILIAMQFSFFVLGAFIDPTGIIMITAPLYFPIIRSLGFDPVWFGVLFIINMEMAYLTPPFGYNLFYMKAVAPKDITLLDIYRSIIPFVILQGIALVICIIFPQIILWLPRMMGLVRGG